MCRELPACGFRRPTGRGQCQAAGVDCILTCDGSLVVDGGLDSAGTGWGMEQRAIEGPDGMFIIPFFVLALAILLLYITPIHFP